MIHLVTFNTSDLTKSALKCATSALAHGVQTTVSRGPFDLPLDMQERCKGQRGFGWWQWKPEVIRREMGHCQDGDILIYADAGIEFIDNVKYIIDRMDQDIFLFGNNWEHAHWCKRDIVETVWPAEWPNPRANPSRLGQNAMVSHEQRVSWANFGKQVQASVIFFRVSDYTRKFVAEWLKWCLHRQRVSTICTDEWRCLIDDSPSIAPNHPEFQENRHDQAILTTMAYREGIKIHAWPAVYNRFLGQEFVYSRDGYPSSDNYPSLFHHHRLRNAEFEAIRPSEETSVTV